MNRNKIALILAWCLLGCALAGAQSDIGFPIAGEDSLLAVVSHPGNDTADLYALKELATQLMWLDKARAREYVDQIINLSLSRDNQRWLANGHRILGNWQTVSGNFDSALYYNQLALDYLLESVPDQDLARRALLNRGTFFLSVSNYEKALEFYQQAYEMAVDGQDAEIEGKALNNLGITFKRMGRNASAAGTYEKSIALKERVGDSLGMANTLSNLGMVTMELYEPEVALAHLQRSKTIFQQLGEAELAASVDLQLGTAYYSTDQFDKALTIWETALAQPGLKVTKLDAAYAYLGMSDIYQEKDRLAEALEYGEAGLYFAHEMGRPRMLADFNRVLGATYDKLDQPDSAAVYFSRYAKLNDELRSVERVQYQQEMAERFETKLRESEIERQGLVIQQQAQRTRILGLGLALLGLMAGGIFLVLRYRLRYQRALAHQKQLQSAQEIRELEQKAELVGLRSMIEGQEAERSRVAKDLHDGLGGLLTTVKVRMNSETTASDEVNGLMDRACTEVRRIAHNLMPQTLSLAGLSGSIKDLGAQLNLQGLDCEVEITGQPDLRLDESRQSMLLRIIQELTHNIVKHASAEKVFIQLLDQPNQLLLTVEDDGVGFTPKTHTHSNRGLGLSSIESRVAYLNGTILYDSSPGHGTTVNVTIPL